MVLIFLFYSALIYSWLRCTFCFFLLSGLSYWGKFWFKGIVIIFPYYCVSLEFWQLLDVLDDLEIPCSMICLEVFSQIFFLITMELCSLLLLRLTCVFFTIDLISFSFIFIFLFVREKSCRCRIYILYNELWYSLMIRTS